MENVKVIGRKRKAEVYMYENKSPPMSIWGKKYEERAEKRGKYKGKRNKEKRLGKTEVKSEKRMQRSKKDQKGAQRIDSGVSLGGGGVVI